MNSPESNLLSETSDDQTMIDPEVALEQTLADPDLMQHIVRSRRDGVETIAGYYRCEFLAGQQRYILHCTFNPPLNEVPNVEAMATDRHDIRARVTDRQKFGARIELILNQPCEEAITLLAEVVASTGTV